MEGFDVDLVQTSRQQVFDGADPFLCSQVRKEIGEGADEDDIGRLNIAETLRDLITVDDPDIIFEMIPEGLFDILRIFHIAQGDGWRKD